MSDYARLAELVAGKDVLFVCAKGRPAAVAAETVIRFNGDPEPGDIWCTSFVSGTAEGIARAPRLIVSTVPDDDFLVKGMGRHAKPRAFREMVAGLAGLANVETVTATDWKALAAAMPLHPLSGLVALYMIARCGAARITLQGMDFYTGQAVAPEFIKGRLLKSAHDMPMALDWYERFLVMNDNIVALDAPPVADMRRIWKRRILLDNLKRLRLG